MSFFANPRILTRLILLKRKKRAEIPSLLPSPGGKTTYPVASCADISDGNIFSWDSGLHQDRRFASQRSSCLFPIMPVFDGRTIAHNPLSKTHHGTCPQHPLQPRSSHCRYSVPHSRQGPPAGFRIPASWPPPSFLPYGSRFLSSPNGRVRSHDASDPQSITAHSPQKRHKRHARHIRQRPSISR